MFTFVCFLFLRFVLFIFNLYGDFQLKIDEQAHTNGQCNKSYQLNMNIEVRTRRKRKEKNVISIIIKTSKRLINNVLCDVCSDDRH